MERTSLLEVTRIECSLVQICTNILVHCTKTPIDRKSEQVTGLRICVKLVHLFRTQTAVAQIEPERRHTTDLNMTHSIGQDDVPVSKPLRSMTSLAFNTVTVKGADTSAVLLGSPL